MPYRRGWIAVFLFTLTMINYMDRIALSIAAKPIASEFKLSTIQMGYLFSSYIWTYAVCLIPVGILIDRFGAKRVGGGGILVWSAATLLTGVSASFSGLLASRLIMGAGESTSNPVAAKIIRQWIPAPERGVMTSLFNSGSYAGPALCSVFLGALVAIYGWRVSFIVAGGIGFVWLSAWLLFFDAPERTRWLSPEEREKIIGERDMSAPPPHGSRAPGLTSLMRTPALWGLAVTQGCNAYTQYLFLTWLPSYLQETRHFGIANTGAVAAIPYAAAVGGCILAGRLSDRYLKVAGVGTGRRRNAVALAMLTGTAILAVPFMTNIVALLCVFSVTLAGIASTSSLNYALLNDLLPDSRDVAKATAFIVAVGNCFGLVAPIATGYVIAATGSYDWAFGIAGFLLIVGAIVVLTMTRWPLIPAPRSASFPSTA